MSPSQASSSSPCFSSGWPCLEYFHAAQKFTSRKTLWPPKLCKFSQNTGVTSKIEIPALIGLDWNLFCLNWIVLGNFWLNSSLAPPIFSDIPTTLHFYILLLIISASSNKPPRPLRGWEEVSRPIRGEIWGKFWNFPNQTNIRTMGNPKYSILW